MGYSKEEFLARLQELQVDFAQYDHPVVLTVEAQAKYVGHMKGALSKNLFLKDKKHRFYIVSSLANTKVDLKILSQRLGLGKGGLRMAPEEALGEILQMVEEDVHSLIEMDNPKGLENVSLGCVTPFAVVNESARHVSLLLDKGFKSQECCFFHPLSNDMSISLDATNLDKFLKSIGRDPIYVDLEANPPVGKDQPPDLAAVVPSDALILQDLPEKAVLEKKDVIVDNNPTAATVKAFKPSNGPMKEKSVNAINKSRSYTDPEKFVEEILEKASAIIISETNEENFKQHGEQLGAVVSYSIKKKLSLELQNLATTFKNAAYTEGFSAGKHYQPYRM